MAIKRSCDESRRWLLRSTSLSLGAPPRLMGPLLMGVVNVTPDSFSDGGAYVDPRRAVDHALELVRQGASVLDIGGESTRPYAAPTSPREELDRVIPVIRELCQRTDIPVSIDTSKAVVAEAALDCGAQIINDVTALEGDPEMLALVVESGAGICLMHMRGTPATMQDDPSYGDVVDEVVEYLRRRRDVLLEAGAEPCRICLDPGIGFGKTHQHNLQLLSHCHRFLSLECPILVGPSRKGFIGHVLGDKGADRTSGTIGVVLALAAQGVHIVRVHDVGPVGQALRLFAASRGNL